MILLKKKPNKKQYFLGINKKFSSTAIMMNQYKTYLARVLFFFSWNCKHNDWNFYQDSELNENSKIHKNIFWNILKNNKMKWPYKYLNFR